MRDISALVAWLSQAPEGTTLDAHHLADTLAEGISGGDGLTVQAGAPSWRVLLWTVAPETRLGVPELLEAVGRSKSWLYRHTSVKGDCGRIPHRKMDGELVFLAGEVRTWLQAHEEIVVAPDQSHIRLTA